MLGAMENGIAVGWLVPKIFPDMERMFTVTVALPPTVRRLTPCLADVQDHLT